MNTSMERNVLLIYFVQLVVAASTLTTIGCTVKAQYGTAADNMKAIVDQSIENDKAIAAKSKLPNSISNALVPTWGQHGQKAYSPKRRFDISVQNIPAKTFFSSLVQDTSLNMVVSPELSGNVTLKLKNVTVDETLQAAQDLYGYQILRTPYGYEIFPNKLKTQMYTLNYLDVKRKAETRTVATSGQITDVNSGTGGATTVVNTGGTSGGAGGQQNPDNASGTRIKTESEIDFWKELKTTLQLLVGKEGGRSVVINPHAGVVVVRAYPDELAEVTRYLDNIQGNMQRQVILEAKILEVELFNEYQAGINWQMFNIKADKGSLMLNALNAFEIPALPELNLKTTIPDAFSGVLKTGRDFEVFFRVLQTQGNIQVLSSPRVSTLNNQQAIIKVGSDQFFVTGVSSSSTTTGFTETPTQDIQLTPFFSGITLDVTPQIGRNGLITLHIHPSVSDVKDQNKNIELGTQGNFNLPLAFSTIRESDTVVNAKNGQIIVIGGLMKNEMKELVGELPFAGRIPFLGTLFRNTQQRSIKTELVILLRPIVVGDKTWPGQLEDSKTYLHQFDRGFQFGGRPDIFGTEGERLPPTYKPKKHKPKLAYSK